MEWNGNMPAPFRTDDSVRFVCVDVEAWERATHIVTEVGLAILDTRDIRGVPPGGVGYGYNWFPLVKSYHFRIREHIDKVNHQFVAGCPESFHFGFDLLSKLKNRAYILCVVSPISSLPETSAEYSVRSSKTRNPRTSGRSSWLGMTLAKT